MSASGADTHCVIVFKWINANAYNDKYNKTINEIKSYKCDKNRYSHLYLHASINLNKLPL